MPRHQKPGTVRFDLDISPEAHARFSALRRQLGFRTKTRTFEAIIYSVSVKDIVDPAVVERMAAKIDMALEAIDALA